MLSSPASSEQGRVQGRHVGEIDIRADPRWDAFVSAHPRGLVYHTSLWLEALAQEYGARPVTLVCEGPNGGLCGVLPLLETRGVPLRRGALTGRRLSSLPRTPVAGPLATDREAAAALVDAAVALAREGRGVQLQLKVREPELDGIAPGLVGTPWRENYVLDLPDDPDALRFGDSRTHARIKWAIGKAARSGVAVRPAQHEDELRAWYSLYLETMRFNAVPPRPYRFFASLWTLLRSRGLFELLIAEEQTAGRPSLLAGSIFLMHGRTVFYAFNGRRGSSTSLALRPNDLIIWNAIRDAVRRGFCRFDLGEVPTGHEGLAQFKRKWGAEPKMLYRYYWPQAAAAGASDAASEPPALATAMWRRMPLRATAVAGDLVYRYL